MRRKSKKWLLPVLGLCAGLFVPVGIQAANTYPISSTFYLAWYGQPGTTNGVGKNMRYEGITTSYAVGADFICPGCNPLLKTSASNATINGNSTVIGVDNNYTYTIFKVTGGNGEYVHLNITLSAPDGYVATAKGDIARH